MKVFYRVHDGSEINTDNMGHVLTTFVSSDTVYVVGDISPGEPWIETTQEVFEAAGGTWPAEVTIEEQLAGVMDALAAVQALITQ